MRRFATEMVALLVAAFLWAAAPAEAIMQVILDDPAVVGEITVTDQSGSDINPVVGVITYSRRRRGRQRLDDQRHDLSQRPGPWRAVLGKHRPELRQLQFGRRDPEHSSY